MKLTVTLACLLSGCAGTQPTGSRSDCSCPVGYTVLSCVGGNSECVSAGVVDSGDKLSDVGASSDAMGALDAPEETLIDALPADSTPIQDAGGEAAESGSCGDIDENCCWGNVCNKAGLWCVYSAYYAAPRCVDSSTVPSGRLSECGGLDAQCCPMSEGINCSAGYQCYIWQVPDAGYPTASSQCEPSSGCNPAGATESLTSLCSTYYGSPNVGSAFYCYGGSTPTGSNSCRQIDEGAGLNATSGPEYWCCGSSPTCAANAEVLADCATSKSEQTCSFGAIPSSTVSCVASTYTPTYGTATITDYCCN
jgi:hypothetical protein